MENSGKFKVAPTVIYYQYLLRETHYVFGIHCPRKPKK